MPSSSVMISTFCYLFAAASVQLLTSSPSPNPAPRKPYDAASSMTFQSLQRRYWILDPHSGASHLPPPSLLTMLIFPLARLLVYLITRGLPVTTQPVWRYRRTHGRRATQQERASFGIKAADPSQAAFIWPSTAIAGTCPVPSEGLTEPQTQRPCGPLGACVQGCEEVFQHTPTPTKQPLAKSQKTRKLSSFSLLAVVTLPIVLSRVIGMANAADSTSILGDSTISLILVSNSTPSFQDTAATMLSTSLSSPLLLSTQVKATTAPTATTSANTSSGIATSRTAVSVALALASISGSLPLNNSTTSVRNPASAPLMSSQNSRYTTVIATTVNGISSINAGAGFTTIEGSFGFSYTTIPTSNTAINTSIYSAPTSLGGPTSSFASSSITLAVSTFLGTATSVAATLSMNTSGTITSLPSISTKITGSVWSAESNLPINTTNRPPAASYVPGRASISSFIPASAANSSNTTVPTPGSATFGLSSSTPTPLFSNSTTSTPSGVIYTTATSTSYLYTTVTSVESPEITSIVMASATALKFASGSRNMSLAMSLSPNAVATVIMHNTFTGAPSGPQNNFFDSTSSQMRVPTTAPVMSEIIIAGTITTSLLTTTIVNYTVVAASLAAGESASAIPIALSTDSVTDATGEMGHLLSTAMAITTSTALAVSQPPVSPVLGLRGREHLAAMPIASIFFHATSTPVLDLPIMQSPPSSNDCNTPPAVTTVPPTTIVISRTNPFTPLTNQPPAAAARVLQDWQSSLVSAKLASWGASQTSSPTSLPLAQRDDATSSGSRLVTLATQRAERAVTCASPLSPIAAVDLVPASQAKPMTTGVCPGGWTAISSGGEKRIKAWYAAGVLNGPITTGLVIGFAILGGAVVRDWMV